MKSRHTDTSILGATGVDLRTKKRRAGEAVRAFEEIIDRAVTREGTAICASNLRRPRLVHGTLHEIVLWDASDTSAEEKAE